MSEDHTTQTPDHSGDGYEKRDVAVGKLLAATAAITVFIAAFVIVLFQYFGLQSQEDIYNAQLAPPSAALLDLRAKEDEILNSYAVVDSTKGIYRIPIDRAMKLLADEAYEQKTKQEGGK